jgi:DNA-binding GntR family transcriptional regulator
MSCRAGSCCIERAFGRGDVAAVLNGDRLFHATLVAATGSPRLLGALRGSRAQARAQLTAHLDAGAAELQRLPDLLTHRKELAHREERETPRG